MASPSLSSTLLGIYRASRERAPDDFHDAALEIVNALVRFDSSTWGVGSMTAQGLAVHSAHLYREVPSRYIGYDEVRREDTVAFETFRRPGTTLNLHLPTLFAGRDKRGVREYARRVRHANELVTTQIVSPDLPVRWLALFRANADDPFSRRDRGLCELLVPHLMEALAANLRIHLHQLADAGGPVFVVGIADRQGFVHHAEPSFTELLLKEWPEASASRIPACLALETAGATECCYRGRHLVAFVSPWRDLLVLKVRERLPVDSLSQRELEIARQIAAGRAHKEIALRLRLAPSTVRNHTQRIHDILGVRNNAELAGLLARAGMSGAS